MKLDSTAIDAIHTLAAEATRRILSVYEGDFAVQRKDDASPLTEADLASHHCIVEGLSALTPTIPIISEESAERVDPATRRAWPVLWLVDPLDGTREFVKRNGEFCINIALVEHGIATWGLIQQPVTGNTWHGGPHYGAWRRDHAGDTAVHAARGHRPLRVAMSRSHRDARTEALVERIGDIQPVSCGSALKFCSLADGRIDLYPRFGPTSEWDTAAGQPILEAAGGAVLDPHGRPFRYNQRDTLLNGDFIALGDASLPWREWLAPE